MKNPLQHVYVFRAGLMHVKFEEASAWINLDQQNSRSSWGLRTQQSSLSNPWMTSIFDRRDSIHVHAEYTVHHQGTME